jgi:hypothetical protein
LLWFLSIRTYLYVIYPGHTIQLSGLCGSDFSCSRDLFWLVSVTLIGVRMAYHFGCRASPCPLCV